MRKQIFSLAFTALCCGILPAIAKDFTYDYTDGIIYYSIIKGAENSVEVTKCMYPPAHLVIPPTINIEGTDYQVVKLADDAIYARDETFESMELPYTMKNIGAMVVNYSSFKHIRFPDNLEYIGDRAFAGCGLKSIIIPDKVKGLVYGAFHGCSQAHTVVLGRGITKMAHNAFGGQALDFKESIYDLSVLREVYSLNPVPPEFNEHARPFNYIGDPNGLILYVPEESIEKYKEYREPVPYYPEYPLYDDQGWQWWTYFKNVKPIPYLFIVNDDTEVKLKNGETTRLYSTIINYADVTIYSDKWECDPAIIKIDADLITAVGPGQTVAKRIVETSTGTYESKPMTVKVLRTSGVEIPVIETESVAPKETEASAADHCFFTIDGMAAGSDADRLAPGIYIERDHGKTRKFIKH